MLSLSDVGPSWSRPNNLISLVKSVQPSLVVIDTISSFWPGIEEKNALTSSKYAEIRSIISSTGCSVVLIHHLSKTPADGRLGLEDSPNPRKWFESVRGASALVNNADIRIGIDSPSTSGIRSKNVELIVGGFGRVRGTIPLTFLTRVRDENGDPLGYSVVTNLDLFDPDVRAFYDKLPDTFTWGAARLLTTNANNWIVGSLGKLKSAGLIRQPVARGLYYKV